MTAVPELGGVDLARQALLAAREQAKKNGARQTKPKRRTTIVARDGREPLAFGKAIGMMMTERGLVAPAVGGSVLAQFDHVLAAVAPELVGHVRAVKVDADTGRLDVVPDAPAYGTKVRWISAKLIATVNEQVTGANVRALYVLPPAPRTTATTSAAAGDPASRSAAPAGLVKTRETASAGYRRALEAHRAVAAPHQEDPVLAAGVVRQELARRELAACAFPDAEPDQSETPTPIDAVRAHNRQAAEAVRAAAIRRARAERSGQPGSAGAEGRVA
ncbi:DUF721 domain-containing protein [Streptomyces sp. NPDC057426]|uniref:DUF721 domain-containing protein n=1 Tax=Streptomyces sp. NPDC057426 TaxID=3346128 RepID=UPI00369C6F43